MTIRNFTQQLIEIKKQVVYAPETPDDMLIEMAVFFGDICKLLKAGKSKTATLYCKFLTICCFYMVDRLEHGRARIELFCEKLIIHAEKKEKLYNNTYNITSAKALRWLIEEVGEVANDITRERWDDCKSGCLDVAHCCYLLICAIEKDLS